MNKLNIYRRADKVSFMDTTDTQESTSFTRMQGFTELSKSSNLKTYSRQYVDEDFEREDAVGYNTAHTYKFDRIVDNAVHNKLATIADEELTNQTVRILTVDLKKPAEGGGYEARLRVYTVLPDAEADGTDAYTYGGTLKKADVYTGGTATISADGLTATFTPEGSV